MRNPMMVGTALALFMLPKLALGEAAAQGQGEHMPVVPLGSTVAPQIAILPFAGNRFDPKQPLPKLDPRLSVTGGNTESVAQVRAIRTLQEAIEFAYVTNPTLLAERATLRSADMRYPAARAAFGPNLDATASYTFTRNRNEILPGAYLGDQGWASSATLLLSQPLLTFGRLKSAQTTALAEIAFQRDRLRIVEAQVMLGVVTDYVSVIRDATAVTIARQNLALLERQYSDSAARFRVREITSTDLQQVQTRVEFGRAQLLSAEGQLAVSQAQFLRDVGAPPGELDAPDALTITAATLPDAYELAEAQSPVIRAAQSREKVSRAAIEGAKAEFAPRLDGRGTANYGSRSPYTDDLRTTELRGQFVLTVPITDGGIRRARLGEARQANEADWRLIEQASRETRAEIASSWNLLAATRASLESYRLATEAAEKAFEGARIQEKTGARTTLDVLDLARDLLTIQTNYNTAIANEYLAKARLLSAMGMLEGPLLVASISRYDPEAHFRAVDKGGDLPLITPILTTIDGSVFGRVAGDRPNLDPAANSAIGASVQMMPEPSVKANAVARRDPG